MEAIVFGHDLSDISVYLSPTRRSVLKTALSGLHGDGSNATRSFVLLTPPQEWDARASWYDGSKSLDGGPDLTNDGQG